MLHLRALSTNNKLTQRNGIIAMTQSRCACRAAVLQEAYGDWRGSSFLLKQ
jgi:hypothetical protein